MSEVLEGPVSGGGVDSSELDVLVAGPSEAKSLRVDNTMWEDLMASFRVESVLLESRVCC